MTISRFSLLALAGAMWSVAVRAEDAPITLPSGMAATLFETRWEPQTAPAEMWVRFRFVVPALAGPELDFEVAGADLAALCHDVALPSIAKDGRKADQAVISLSSQAIPFGETNPDVTQVFEAFGVSSGDCILEEF